MAKPIFQTIDQLPSRNMTVRILHALDWVVPGEWHNVVGFDNMIRAVSGEKDPTVVRRIGERSIALYNDKTQGYQRALWLYQSADTFQGISGFAALLNKLGETFRWLRFLQRITPKSDTLQSVDLSLKLVVELVAYCNLNGIPGNSVGDFVKGLSDYRHEALMRMAAIVCLDGLLPLGPDFVGKVQSLIGKTGVNDLEKNPRFQQIRSYIPGNTTADQLSLIQKSIGSIGGWMSSFVASRNLGVDKIMSQMAGTIQGWEGRLDYVAAWLDMTTNYVEHTGSQTVARSLISRAAAEI